MEEKYAMCMTDKIGKIYLRFILQCWLTLKTVLDNLYVVL